MFNVMDLFTLDTYPSSLNLTKLNETNKSKSNIQSNYNELNLWVPYYIKDCVLKEGSCYFDVN